MTIGKKISACRRKAGLSQEALAEKLHISRQAVSRWETGESAPDLENVKSLCRLFQVSADYLLFDELERETTAPGTRGEAQDAAREKSKRWFRIAVLAAVLVLGILLMAAAIHSALTTSTYDEAYYETLGPVKSYLFASWRTIPLVSGLVMIVAGAIGLFLEYRKL